jgi:hypothetical protein
VDRGTSKSSYVVDIGAGEGAGVLKGEIAGLESDEWLASGKLLDDRVEMFDGFLTRHVVCQRDHPHHQQRDAQVPGSIDFGHVFLPGCGIC